jgi:hypothetical protein
MRFTDDFLLATPCLRAARRFATVLHEGLPEYGCNVNPDKTVVNFDITVQNGCPLKRFDREDNDHDGSTTTQGQTPAPSTLNL